MALTLVCAGPDGIIGTQFPTIEWVYDAPEDAESPYHQASAQVLVFAAAAIEPTGPDDFVPEDGEATWAGGVADDTTSVDVDVALDDGEYYAYTEVTAVDGSTTGWCYSAFTVAVATSVPTRRPGAVAGILGCGSYQAFIQPRGGGRPIGELQWQSLSFGRALDEMTTATLTVGATGLANQECCWALAQARPWEHELSIHRDGEEVWVGVWARPIYGLDQVRVTCRDLFQWLERRLLPRDRTFVNHDLGIIFGRYALDALSRDDSPNITVTSGICGVLGDRSVAASARRFAADEMRELSRTGVDFTMLVRELLVGGVEVPTPELPTLVDGMLDGPQLAPDGLAGASEVVVTGARRENSDEPYVGVAGGVDTRIGLVQQVVAEPSIRDNLSCIKAARTRLDLWDSGAPEILSGDLEPHVPVPFAHLVPGARWPAQMQLACRFTDEEYRLLSVGVQASTSDAGASEQITVVLEPLGSVES
jgi:hypothetical protein